MSDHLTEHFTMAEARDRRGNTMPPEVVVRVRRMAVFLERVRASVDAGLNITSWFRSSNHPIERRKPRPGAHSTGQAVDVHCHGRHALKVLKAALNAAPTDADGCPKIGIGIRQKGARSNRILHIDRWQGDDLSPRPHIWSY